MRYRITQFMSRRVSSDGFDLRLGQAACFVVSVVVFALSIWKFTRLDLTEAQLFFGVLLSGCVPLLCVVVGLLLPVARAGRKSTA